MDRHKMGDKHETFLAKIFGGRKTRGSGNQWRDPMDGRNNRYEQEFAWAWDGKSTLGETLTMSRKMWAKAIEQAGSERPLVALRFYNDERLRSHTDLVVVGVEDFLELCEAASVHEECL